MRPSRRGVVHAPYLLYGCSRWIGERGLRLGSSHSSTAHKDIWRSPSSAGFDPPCPTGGRVWAFGGAGSREDNGDPHALRAHKADQRRMQRAGVFPGKGPGGRPCRVRCDACKRPAIRPYDGPAEFAVFRTGGGHGGKSRRAPGIGIDEGSGALGRTGEARIGILHRNAAKALPGARFGQLSQRPAAG